MKPQKKKTPKLRIEALEPPRMQQSAVSRRRSATKPLMLVDYDRLTGDRSQRKSALQLVKHDQAKPLAEGAAAVKSAPLALDPAVPVGAAFRAIAGACADHLVANKPAALEGRDPEGVHQMRVALRRLRSACGLFRPAVSGSEADAILAEAKWLAGVLGPARDADVFAGELLAPVSSAFDGDAAFEALRHAAEDVRRDRYRLVRSALQSPRYAAFTRCLDDWVTGGRRRPASDEHALLLERPIVEFAGDVMDRRYRKVRKLGKRSAALDIAGRHRLRIQIKKLRYAAEFFQGLYGKKATGAYLNRLAALQGALGYLNDVATARHVARSILDGPRAAEHNADLHWAAGAVAGWHEQRAAAHWQDAVRQWRKLRKQPKFWH